MAAPTGPERRYLLLWVETVLSQGLELGSRVQVQTIHARDPGEFECKGTGWAHLLF